MPRNRETGKITLAQGKDVKRSYYEERRQRALDMRKAGASLHDIIRAGIGYNSIGYLSQDLRKAYENVWREDNSELVVLDVMRLDEYQKRVEVLMRQNPANLEAMRMALQIMKFRQEMSGVTPEAIQEQRLNAANVTNNGLMVIQGGTNGEYLKSLMQAAGLTEQQAESEIRKAIPGEVVERKAIEAKEQPKGPVVVLKTRRSARKPQDASVSAVQARPVSRPHLDPARPLEERLEAFDPHLELPEQSPAGLDEPHIESNIERVRYITDPETGKRIMAVEVKDPDANQPASPGVPYRQPPRKMNPKEGYAPANSQTRAQDYARGTQARVRAYDPLETETRQHKI